MPVTIARTASHNRKTINARVCVGCVSIGSLGVLIVWSTTDRHCSSDFPRRTIIPRHQFARAGIIKDFFVLDTPADFSAGEHRDQPEMPGNRGMVRGLDRCDRGLSGFYTINEVSRVVAGFVQFYFA